MLAIPVRLCVRLDDKPQKIYTPLHRAVKHMTISCVDLHTNVCIWGKISKSGRIAELCKR